MSADVTIIYYTCGRERPTFEGRIQQQVLALKGDRPLISVSHAPLDFGRNLCVGEHPLSAHNVWRQFQLGAMEATTPFVCTHEADFLFPPEYFAFTPTQDDVFYIANPLWVLFALGDHAPYFVLKRGAENSMIIGREFIIERIEHMLAGRGMWDGPDSPPLIATLYKLGRREDVVFSNPIVTFKTGHGMHRRTPHARNTRRSELPYWGTAADLVRTYCEDST